MKCMHALWFLIGRSDFAIDWGDNFYQKVFCKMGKINQSFSNKISSMKVHSKLRFGINRSWKMKPFVLKNKPERNLLNVPPMSALSYRAYFKFLTKKQVLNMLNITN